MLLGFLVLIMRSCYLILSFITLSSVFSTFWSFTFILILSLCASDSNLLNLEEDLLPGKHYGSEQKLREEFAKTCFETLLQFSLLDGVDPGDLGAIEGGLAGRLAVTALLHRFQEVLRQYVADERLSGRCPLPRYRLSEISFVLKAVATLVVSLKKAPSSKVDRSAWEQLIGLYPYLVDCTATASSQVSHSLREALLQYSDLLQPPGLPNGV